VIEVEPSISEKNTAKRRFDALFAAQLADHVIEGLRETWTRRRSVASCRS